MFNLNIKAWDNYKGEFLFWKKFNTTNSSLYTFANEQGTNRVGWVTVQEHPKRYTICFSLGQVDKNKVILYSGDIVLNEENELGTIEYSKSRGGFFVRYNGKLKYIETSKVTKVGDIFNKANKVKEIKNVNRR